MRIFWIPLLSLSVLSTSTLLVQSCTKKNEPQKTETASNKKLYRCSMHPQVTSDKPGICPICHMNLELIEETQSQPNATPSSNSLSGRASFSLTPERQQMIGVTTEKAIVREIGYEVRANGRVAFDPDLYTAIEEYKQAVQSKGLIKDAPMLNQANELISSAKIKLKLLGLSENQIQTLHSAKSNSINLLLPSGAVWIYAEVFEYELSGLKSGLKIEVQSPSVPGKTFSGKISSINPVVNSPTRTVRVRALVPDPAGDFRPDMYVNVKIKIDLGNKLAVPESAVLFSGNDTFVFVSKEAGHFDPRPIRLGIKAQNYYEVLSGLSEGEKIVTSANFLIDSESRLRGVLENVAPTNGGK